MDFKNERLIMSEEEVRNRAKELLNESQEDLITKYMFLEQQCKKQKEVIDKLNDLLSDEFLEVIDRDTLLDILKEVSK